MSFFDHPNRMPGIGDEQAAPMLWYPRASTSGCRLSLDRTRSVPTSDQSAKSLIYVVPHESNIIECWSGEDWVPRCVPYDLGSTQTRNALRLEISGSVDATNYDVYVRNVCGQWSIMHRAWPTTTRGSVPIHPDMHPDGVGMRDGRLVLGSWGGSVFDCQPAIDPTWLYLGTFRTSATGQTEDSATKRFVWNMYNQASRPFKRIEATSTWTYGTSTWRQANAASANQVECVTGLTQFARPRLIVGSNDPSADSSAGIGVDSTTPHADCYMHYANAVGIPHVASLDHAALGYRAYKWCELRVSGGTAQFYGTTTYGGNTYAQCGLSGEVMA